VSFGRRGTVYRGFADLQKILQTEMNMRHPEDIEAAQGDAEGAQEFSEKMQSEKEKMLMMSKYYSLFAYQD
jgi:phage terminase large subunit-like protein